MNFVLNWEGRRLSSASISNYVISFEYDDAGRRISKTEGSGVTKYYYYDGDLLIAEHQGDYITVYLYDDKGMPVGFAYREAGYALDVWDIFWYEKNLQGDIVAVYSQSGDRLVSYAYDAWGNFVTNYLYDVVPNGVYANNLRYRGYYYDNTLGLYYCGTRYYDSNTGRWINADSMMSGVNGSLHEYNLYVYCFNNPVMHTDHSRNWPEWVENAYEWIDENVFRTSKKFIDDLSEDLKNYDKNNSSEQKVLDSNYISSYNGILVIRTNGKRSGAFGAIFLTRETNSFQHPEDTLRHEYGHVLQKKELNFIDYISGIFIPSWQQWGPEKYYDKPWEVTADIYGGVQSRIHSSQIIENGFNYLANCKWNGPFVWLYIFKRRVPNDKVFKTNKCNHNCYYSCISFFLL